MKHTLSKARARLSLVPPPLPRTPADDVRELGSEVADEPRMVRLHDGRVIPVRTLPGERASPLVAALGVWIFTALLLVAATLTIAVLAGGGVPF